ncbi:MAG: hypothetical protein M1546_10445, partial [Chloroflexi bacterium]|nr:hypothetical protein [Chloroflexota bacterium]
PFPAEVLLEERFERLSGRQAGTGLRVYHVTNSNAEFLVTLGLSELTQESTSAWQTRGRTLAITCEQTCCTPLTDCIQLIHARYHPKPD